MRGKVLVLSDRLDLRAEVFTYALELASRTDSSLFLLVILAMGQDADRPANDQSASSVERTLVESLNPHIETARKAGIEFEAMLKRGTPSSEVFKFLAESNAIHTIVWGGERSLASEKVRNKKTHWLAQIRDTLPCPVVIPVPKSNEDKPL